MTAAHIVTVIASLAGQVTVAAAVVRAWRVSNQLQARRRAEPGSVARAARSAPTDHVIDE